MQLRLHVFHAMKFHAMKDERRVSKMEGKTIFFEASETVW